MTELELEKDLKIIKLKCNYLDNPLGVDTSIPMLSWMLHSVLGGKYQKAYRVIAASKLKLLNPDKSDLWDSGWIESDKCFQVPYNGKPLKSRQQVFWKVCIMDEKNNESDWSGPAVFEMGLMNEKEWTAKWIAGSDRGTDLEFITAAPLIRKSVDLNKKIRSARAYICGLGYYELYINGLRVGNNVLTPAFTQYDKTLLYDTYDITGLLAQGENVLGVILGNGWYNCFTTTDWDTSYASWRHNPKLISQFNIEFEDGEELVVKTDSSWKAIDGPIVYDGLRNGEFYDARLEKPGWNMKGYNDTGWVNAKIARCPGGLLKSFQMTPIKINGTIKPVSLKEVETSVWVYDLGQNISGWAQLKVKGPAGTEIILKYGEKLDSSGMLDTGNIDTSVKSGEFQTDRYILKGEGTELWEPGFTYHGFQYVQVTGYPGVPTLDSLSGRVVHTALESAGEFICSNELLNKIQKNTIWSARTNYHGIPTDCPHREKNGWSGDAMLSAEQLLLNFDPLTAYAKWMRDFKDVQRISGQLPGIIPSEGWGYNWASGPAWDSAVILIPWYVYLYYGDTSVLVEMYETMSKYMDFLANMAENHIVDFRSLGDWCMPTGGPNSYKCPTMVTDTAYYFVDAVVIAKIAALLDKKEDEKDYSKLAQDIRNAFRSRFIDVKEGKVEGDCQTSYACVLFMGLINDDEKPLFMERLIAQVELYDDHINCGILGTKFIMNALSDMGRTDLAYKMATQTTFPSWGYWIEQGATTLWETWNGNASRNHHMFSDISAWFYKSLAGINPDPEEPGFKHIIIRPNPVPGLNWVHAKHISLYGEIECKWEVADDEFKIAITVPPNCHATFYTPLGYLKDTLYLEPGQHKFNLMKC